MFSGLLLLVKVRVESQEVISEHSNSKIKSTIIRMCIFATMLVIFCVITFFYHHYIYTHGEEWEESLKDYIT